MVRTPGCDPGGDEFDSRPPTQRMAVAQPGRSARSRPWRSEVRILPVMPLLSRVRASGPGPWSAAGRRRRVTEPSCELGAPGFGRALPLPQPLARTDHVSSPPAPSPARRLRLPRPLVQRNGRPAPTRKTWVRSLHGLSASPAARSSPTWIDGGAENVPASKAGGPPGARGFESHSIHHFLRSAAGRSERVLELHPWGRWFDSSPRRTCRGSSAVEHMSSLPHPPRPRGPLSLLPTSVVQLVTRRTQDPLPSGAPGSNPGRGISPGGRSPPSRVGSSAGRAPGS